MASATPNNPVLDLLKYLQTLTQEQLGSALLHETPLNTAGIQAAIREFQATVPGAYQHVPAPDAQRTPATPQACPAGAAEAARLAWQDMWFDPKPEAPNPRPQHVP